jgi:putrescine aminotransferase
METSLATVTKAEISERFSRHVSSGKVAFFQRAGIDFILGHRDGAYLWDVSGEKKLIDCHCNGGVFNLGHRHPELVETLVDGLAELDIGNHHLISKQRAELAGQLADLLPGDLSYVVFNVSGGEAVDLAIKVARGCTGRLKIISARGGYHGHTGLALAAGDESYRSPFGPQPPGFQQVPFNDVRALSLAMDDDTAAVILETVPATYGIAVPRPDYLPQVRELCDQHGALLISDEIQTGLGRTGKLWGVEHFGVEPDILVIGKGLSGGLYPITATCLRSSLESIFHADPFIHVSTFGGAEVGCLVAMKVLEISASADFLDHVNQMADLFRQGFKQLQEKHAVLVRLRQLGLMMGIELVDPQLGPLFTRMAYECGLLSVYANNDTRVAQLLPPLIVDEPLVEKILARVDQALELVTQFMNQGRG